MRLLVFGYGYSAHAIAERLRTAGHEIAATVQTAAKAGQLSRSGIRARLFSDGDRDPAIAGEIAASDAVLVSIPPDQGGDRVLAAFGEAIAAAPRLGWIGYLSTVGVYGDHAGGWVDETTPVVPREGRSRLRAEAERAWLDFGATRGKATHLFRLAGIYGPGRNQLAQLAAGTARRIVKPGQVFNRIHVADIAAVVEASLMSPRAGAVYNVSDDEPAPPQDVVSFAAKLCGIAPPPEIPFAEADLTPMGRSFYDKNNRVRNALIRSELGVVLRYPNYREGLTALRASGEGPNNRARVETSG
ncbi:SDR family oxidoreductase [Bradyrhizobium jicamae]|uniref:SDR family oxidoreductase n=1 Tax=Bradyrhizobium jicamae TaxID=280332 RepID=A0ABS5FJ01_9BRAD|nr:SDR family oxidoreductase [Bradyrhizobium jicamae]MBR0796750.1 SDR family oxidoreductase [Bradyrhizobium jicamae]